MQLGRESVPCLGPWAQAHSGQLLLKQVRARLGQCWGLGSRSRVALTEGRGEGRSYHGHLRGATRSLGRGGCRRQAEAVAVGVRRRESAQSAGPPRAAGRACSARSTAQPPPCLVCCGGWARRERAVGGPPLCGGTEGGARILSGKCECFRRHQECACMRRGRENIHSISGAPYAP